ncbi:glycosyltransferase [Rhodocyclus tenuis]|uniref:Glycosyltransferase n=1 Tax=Rhodocyclus tenuis TaxID=1066 RepID=A0A6L5JUJ9_RHOTE|nr:glycosyltransferase family 4 protein [Rhodocyclus gracilis]MQY51037.1 glycosyltransferase [Rhodocyclus gracilis]MRD73016.1 glycosyltransferase [Rhodocyclus gracilis]
MSLSPHITQPDNDTNKLRVLLVHNAYQQRGGEDAVVDAEHALLREHGHAVELFQRHNDELLTMPRWQAALNTLWSSESAVLITRTIERFRPEVVHFHNTFPLISPAAYWAVRAAGLPVIQTLHNFRLHCPQAIYLRDGKVCEECKGRVPWRSVVHACYRGSRAQSAVASGMLLLHRARGSYRHAVTRYIALNDFCRETLLAGGLPASRVRIKPNFVDFTPPPADALRSGFLYVGRLSEEKGIAVLCAAWAASRGQELRVAGAGPDAALIGQRTDIRALGALSGADVRREMGRATALVLPSICYDSFPRTLVEAFACGLPVIASRLGPLTQLIDDGVTGLLFEAGNADELAQKLVWASEHPQALAEMGRRARARYEAEFSAERNYAQLMAIYREAISAINEDADA